MLKLQPRSYDWALNHIEKYGDTDIFPIPFEFSTIRSYWDKDVRPELSQQNVLEWELRYISKTTNTKTSLWISNLYTTRSIGFHHFYSIDV